MRHLLPLAALALAGCMGSGEGPVVAQAPPAVPPQAAVATPSAAPQTVSAAPPAMAVQPSPLVSARAPGARESVGLSNVSRSSSGAGTSGGGLGGTVVSGQSSGLVPTTIDRHREPPRTRSTAPRDTLGPGTAPPVIAPELRDTTGQTLRNRQRVTF